jgi:hypothetical protein
MWDLYLGLPLLLIIPQTAPFSHISSKAGTWAIHGLSAKGLGLIPLLQSSVAWGLDILLATWLCKL